MMLRRSLSPAHGRLIVTLAKFRKTSISTMFRFRTQWALGAPPIEMAPFEVTMALHGKATNSRPHVVSAAACPEKKIETKTKAMIVLMSPSYARSFTTSALWPVPDGLAPDVPTVDYAGDPRSVAFNEAARRLVGRRDRWLNPPEWAEWADEPVPGYPQRPVAREAEAAKALKARTLTNLNNDRPQWLADAHAVLDAAVAAAYGWDAGISDDEALIELLALNLAGEAPK